MYSIIFLATTAFLLCLLLTPTVRYWSHRLDFVDHPNAKRKIHAVSVPRTGGVAIALAYLGAMGLFLFSPLNATDSVNIPFAVGLIPSTLLIFIIGLVDDRIPLNAKHKFSVQIIAALLAFGGGVRVTGVAGYEAPLWLSMVVTVAWLVACCNAFNLIDGMDGLATGIGLFAAFTTLTAALLQENTMLALVTAPLFGALLAFLRYNFNPASIFLGDCGSLTIGFLLGCFGALWSQKSATVLGMTAPVMALSLRLLDTSISVVRRFVRRQPVFSPDRNHLHHRLLDRGLSTRQAALVLYAMCALAAAFSLIQTVPGNHFNGLLLVAFCFTAWVAVQIVGYTEFDTARHLALTGTFRHIVNARLFVEGFERAIVAARTTEEHWRVIRDVSHELGCSDVRMSLGGRIYEDVHVAQERRKCCVIRIPLEGTGYVNFRYPAEASVRYTVAVTSIAQILQRSGVSRRIAEAAAEAAEAAAVENPAIRMVKA